MTAPDKLFVQIHDLASRVLDDEASPADVLELDRLITTSAEARRVYVAYMSETAVLRWHTAERQPELARDLLADGGPQQARWSATTPLLPMTFLASLKLMAIAAGMTAAVIAVVGAWIAWPQPAAETAFKPGSVATLIRATGVRWTGDAITWPELTRLTKGDVLRFDAGEIELVFDTGVEVIVRGPADFEIQAVDRAFSRLGRISARVGADGEGFTIETPVAKVVDLGTEFAVEVTPSGSTDVAVFQGKVDLAVRGPAEPGKTAPRRLVQGEGMRVEPGGKVGRVMAISSDRFPESPRAGARSSLAEPIILDVRDNSPIGEMSKFYRIVRGGLTEDVPAYVDRNHEWNGVTSEGLPACLAGIEYVMTFNDDKFVEGFEMSVDVARPATLYVFVSDRVPVPEWLRSGFVDTGLIIGLDEARSRYRPRHSTAEGAGASIDTTFSVWRRDVAQPETVVLGGISPSADRVGFNMYGIAAAPLVVAPKADGPADR